MAEQPGGRDWIARTLRELREAAGMSGVQAARLAGGLSQPKLNRIEHGQFLPKTGEIQALCRVYRAPRETQEALLAAERTLRGGTAPARTIITQGSWKMQYRVGQIEQASAEVCVYQPALIPGLLQTPAYMRLVFADGGDITGEDLEQAVAERIRRQDVLASERSFVLLMAEGALRWQAGSPQIMLEQLGHIADVIQDRPNVQVGIIPQYRAADVFTTHGFSLYDQRTVILGVRTGTSFITKAGDVADYAKLFAELAALAVYGSEAADVIGYVADGYGARPE